mgnify:CR=1 FL=1|jgi:F0F1-type ATP synthase assembly protein I
MKDKKEKEAEKKKKRTDKLRAFATYSNIAFSILGAALLGYLVGSLLDRYLLTEKPIWTGIFVALFTLLYLSKIILELLRP